MPRGTGLLLNGARTKCHSDFLFVLVACVAVDVVVLSSWDHSMIGVSMFAFACMSMFYTSARS